MAKFSIRLKKLPFEIIPVVASVYFKESLLTMILCGAKFDFRVI